MKSTLSLLVLAGAALSTLPAVSQAQAYRVSALTFGGNADVSPNDAAGSFVVGNVYTDAGVRGALWGPSGERALTVPEGGFLLGVGGVNRSGDAVGTGSLGAGAVQGLRWRNGTVEALPVSDGDGDVLYGSRASGINDSGTIIGGGETAYGTNGVVWQNGDIRILRGLEAGEYERSAAHAINGAGQIAGSANTGVTGNVPHAVVWEADGSVRELAGLGEYSVAYGLNAGGTAVGYAVVDGNAVAFVNNGGVSTLLPVLAGALDGSARDVSDSGLIVGSSSDAATYEGIATLWQGGQAYDLNSLIGGNASEWQLVSATTIGDDGTIYGFGYHRGVPSSFQMTPVPEPATIAALGLGVLAFARRRRTNR